MPVRSVKVHENEILSNKVNRKVYYEKNVKDLRDTKPRNWWRDVKQLCGTAKRTGNDLKTRLHPDLIYDEKTLAQNINEAFISTMKDYSPLTGSVQVAIDDDEPISVTKQAVIKKLLAFTVIPLVQVALMIYLIGSLKNLRTSWQNLLLTSLTPPFRE